MFVADAMAWALHANGRDAEALEFADRAAALGWRNATFGYHRGMILDALGRSAEAEAQLADALAINPHFSRCTRPAPARRWTSCAASDERYHSPAAGARRGGRGAGPRLAGNRGGASAG